MQRSFRLSAPISIGFCLILCGLGQATTRYVAPGGTGNGLTESTPLGSLATGVNSVGPGDTLMLLDGEYHESLNLTKSGLAGQPITARAKNVGAAFIDGDATRVPVSCWQQTWWNLDGLRAGNSVRYVYDLNYCHHFRITRCSGFDAAGATSTTWTNYHIFNIAYADSVFAEDVWAWGGGRYSFIYYGCSGCQLRRGVFMTGPYWSTPHAGLAVYCSDHTLVENVLVFGTRLSAGGSGCVSGFVCEGHDCPSAKASGDNRFYGCIAIDNGQSGQVTAGVFVWNEFVGTFEDMVVWKNTGDPFAIASATPSTYPARSLEGSPANVVKNTGPQILTRYVDGVLSAEALWPWPYESVMQQDFGMSETVTEYVRRQLAPYIDIPLSSVGPAWRSAGMPRNRLQQAGASAVFDVAGRRAGERPDAAAGVLLVRPPAGQTVVGVAAAH